MSPTGPANDDWGTPQALYDALDREFGFDVDLCADETNHKHTVYFDRTTDALSQDWTAFRACFLNPPYGKSIPRFVEKAVETMNGGGPCGRGTSL